MQINSYLFPGRSYGFYRAVRWAENILLFLDSDKLRLVHLVESVRQSLFRNKSNKHGWIQFKWVRSREEEILSLHHCHHACITHDLYSTNTRG